MNPADSFVSGSPPTAKISQRNIVGQIETLVLANGFSTLVHMSLGDKSGDSAVIEYIAGKAKACHDKRFTVIPNEPTYDKQIENLKQYRTFGGDKPLPGERTPTDRFVCAAYDVENLPKPTCRDEGAAYASIVLPPMERPARELICHPSEIYLSKTAEAGLKAPEIVRRIFGNR